MAIRETRERRAVCPHCDATDGLVDHLQAGQSAGPWYCKACGGSYVLRVPYDGEIVIEPREGRRITTYDVLVLRPQEKPVYFVVEGMRFEGERWQNADEDESASKQFFYEEHSCPTNWLEPEMVYFDGDTDPHGLIEFVATRDADTFPPVEDTGPNDHDAALVEFIQRNDSPR